MRSPAIANYEPTWIVRDSGHNPLSFAFDVSEEIPKLAQPVGDTRLLRTNKQLL